MKRYKKTFANIVVLNNIKIRLQWTLSCNVVAYETIQPSATLNDISLTQHRNYLSSVLRPLISRDGFTILPFRLNARNVLLILGYKKYTAYRFLRTRHQNISSLSLSLSTHSLSASFLWWLHQYFFSPIQREWYLEKQQWFLLRMCVRLSYTTLWYLVR